MELTHIHALFAAQPFMTLLGAELVRVERGLVEIALPRSGGLLQHTGVLHAGVLTALLDSACGGAAQTTMDDGDVVVSVEFKVNLLAPAAGERFLVRGEVLKAGRRFVVCRGDAFCVDQRPPRLVAAMQATMTATTPRA